LPDPGGCREMSVGREGAVAEKKRTHRKKKKKEHITGNNLQKKKVPGAQRQSSRKSLDRKDHSEKGKKRPISPYLKREKGAVGKKDNNLTY